MTFAQRCDDVIWRENFFKFSGEKNLFLVDFLVFETTVRWYPGARPTKPFTVVI